MTMRTIFPLMGMALVMATVSPLALAQTDPDAAYIPPPPPGLVKRLQQEGQTSAHDSTRIIPRVAPEMTPEPYSPAEVPPPPLARPSMDAAPAVVPEVVSNEPYVPAMMERMNAEASAVTPSGDFQRLEDVLRASYIDNPTLRAARSEMKATHERLPQAQAGWKPTLAGEAAVTWADIDQSPAAVVGGGDGTTSTQVGLSATQPLYRGGRTVAAVDGAENLINAQRAILNATEQRIMRDVATAYMDVVRDQAVLELRTNNKAVIERQLEATSDRFEVGELTRTDVSQAEARLAGAEADRTRAVGNLRTSRSIYRQLTGMEAGALGYPQLAFNIPPTLDSAMKVAEADNPAVVASRFRHKASQSDIKGIFGELLPLVQLFASWDKEYDPQPGILDEVTTSAIGVNATVPFYSGGATRSRVREAKYIANQRMITIQETVRQAVQEAVANWESLAAAKAEITSREAQVAAAAIAREGVYQEAELGSRTILDTLDADQEYLDAQVALVTARRNETVATFFLASTLGLLTPKTLGFSEIAADHDAHLKYTTGKILGMDVDIVEEGR